VEKNNESRGLEKNKSSEHPQCHISQCQDGLKECRERLLYCAAVIASVRHFVILSVRLASFFQPGSVAFVLRKLAGHPNVDLFMKIITPTFSCHKKQIW